MRLEWCGSPSYAVDLTLLSASIKEIRKMVNMCAEFNIEFGVKGKKKNSKCMVSV